MLEEHGPYLPAYTDGILSERLTDELARAAVSGMPGWTVLRFPQMPVGSSGSNELGGQFVFPGHLRRPARHAEGDVHGSRRRARRSGLQVDHA
jgi:creatinine amidohydrolase/Fe(II)-dependent formamide hydrolase-like protein